MKFLKNILFVAILSLLIACHQNQEAPADTAKEQAVATTAAPDEITFTRDQYNLAAIQIGKIESRNLNSTIKVSGVVDVEPASVVTISAPLGGYIQSAGLLPGQVIKKGQVIATLENPAFIDLQQEYLESKSRLQFLEQEYLRQRQLREEDVNSAKTFQQVSSDFQVMQARVSALEAKIALAGINKQSLQTGKISRTANLYAPINGYVKTSNVNIGKFVNPTDVLFELANKNELHLALNVFEKDINQIKIGQSIRFGLASETELNRTATVYLIGQATTEDRMIPVHCHLSESGNSDLLPGMFVKAWIEEGTQSVPALPTEAVVQSEGKDYIILQTKNTDQIITFRMVPVKKGIQEENLTQVMLPSTVSATEAAVVTKGAYTVLSALLNAGEEE